MKFDIVSTIYYMKLHIANDREIFTRAMTHTQYLKKEMNLKLKKNTINIFLLTLIAFANYLNLILLAKQMN